MKIEITTWKVLDDLMKAKKPFVLTANGHNGGTAEILDWDGKELTDEAVHLIWEKIGKIRFEYINLDGFTIICDENGFEKQLEGNVAASRLAHFDVVGDVVISFPN